MNILQNLLTGLAKPIMNKGFQAQNLLKSFSAKPNNQMGPTYPTTTSPMSPPTTKPPAPVLPKTNTQDVKSSTLSSPTYNPNANVMNDNFTKDYTGQQTETTTTSPTTPVTPTATPTVTTPAPVESEADKWFKMYQGSMAMTPQEEALQKQLSNLTTGADLGVAGLEGQGRGIPLSLVRGQQEKLLKQAAIQTQPLQKQLELLQAKRQAEMEGAKAGMDYYKPTSTDYKSVSAGETLIDPKTGKVIYQGAPKEQSMSEKYGTGTIGEYNFYADLEKNAGRTPVSFNEYQNMDANRKARITAAANSGLTANQINSTVNSIAGAFDNEPIVKNYNTAQEGYQTISSIGVNTKSPADDIAFIYAFAKIMDPNSVVREGEYNTIQKYAQSWAQTFGFNAKRIFSNTNFLSAQAKQNMLNALTPKINTITGQYNNIRSEYQRQIDDAYAGKPRTIQEYKVNTNTNNTSNQPQTMELNGKILTLQADGTYK